MTRAATAFLESLDADHRRTATDRFDVPDHRLWTYLPGSRAGVSLAEMNVEQRRLALELLDAGCSAEGAKTARRVIELDMIRRQLTSAPSSPPDPRDDRFWFRILGDPTGDEPWAWRANGHHLAVHATVVDGAATITPHFFGAEPAVVPHGPHAGLRTLPDEEEIARTMLASFDSTQREIAVFSPIAPDDILTRFDPVADPNVIPEGLNYARMRDSQRDTLRHLIRLYLDRAPTPIADAAWSDAVAAGLDDVQFTWAGPDQRGEGHYYAVRGPTFLIEYDNTQNDANHAHSVWRDLRNDWGEDLLVAHYASDHYG
jgi:hypothetical protein